MKIITGFLAMTALNFGNNLQFLKEVFAYSVQANKHIEKQRIEMLKKPNAALNKLYGIKATFGTLAYERYVQKRVQKVPPLLVLAQAAIESSWGRSRFVKEANNLFGVRSYNKNVKGLKPSGLKKPKFVIVKYDSKLHSIQKYMQVLNSSSKLELFRRLRQKTKDVFKLSYGLVNYSEQRQAYVKKVQKVLRYIRKKYPKEYEEWCVP